MSYNTLLTFKKFTGELEIRTTEQSTLNYTQSTPERQSVDRRTTITPTRRTMVPFVAYILAFSFKSMLYE